MGVVSNFVPTPYTVKVLDLMRHPGDMRESTLTIVAPDKLGEGLVAVPEGGTVTVDLRLESLHEGILASGDVTTQAVGECGRCLREIALPVQVEFAELFAYSHDEAFDFEVHDDHVNLEPLIRDAVVLSLPFQPVCRPDCPGLDPVTGERLEHAPEAATQETPDPRWAALAGFTASADQSEDEPETGASPDQEKS